MKKDYYFYNSDDLIVSYFGLKNLDNFKKNFIDQNRGKALFLIRFEEIKGIDILDFINIVREDIKSANDLQGIKFGFHIMDSRYCLLMGIVPISEIGSRDIPNLDNALGIFHIRCKRDNLCSFNFGIARTQCNWVSDLDEIFDQLDNGSQKNLEHNISRWTWTNFNKANTYFHGDDDNAVIQPTIAYNPKEKNYTVIGGEVFVGGNIYQTYHELLADVPAGEDPNRIELLILEKLIFCCKNAPGLLKFNVTPQTLIDTFTTSKKIDRLFEMVKTTQLEPANVRFELVEQSYQEKERQLQDICKQFYHYGFSFAADDFGVNSSSHQVVLELGEVIKEFKLDPMSFRFKVEEDNTKFLDNLAFLEYCNHLADNRNAVITAEAVEDYDTLKFLIEHKVHHFQSFLFCGKLPVKKYREQFSTMRNLREETIKQILQDKTMSARLIEVQNIFQVAQENQLQQF